MQGDIALAGFVLTAEEWQALDPESREALVSAAELPPPPTRTARGSGPIEISSPDDDAAK